MLRQSLQRDFVDSTTFGLEFEVLQVTNVILFSLPSRGFGLEYPGIVSVQHSIYVYPLSS